MSARSVHQAAWEVRLLLRNGEQLLLTFVIPVALLLGLGLTSLMPDAYGDSRVAQALATVLAVSVISAAFTSLAIATGFERRSGALRFLGTTPLSRVELLAGKALATLTVTVLSSAAVGVAALIIGWRPTAPPLWTPLLILLGTAAFAACGVALAGLFRAEAVLAIANGLFLVLILFGGVIIPASSLPGPLATAAPWLPSGALADALTEVLVNGHSPGVGPILVLAGWLVVGTTVSARTFRWS
ncbi:MAG: ABC transporter permease [bacterium]|nr:ABC transporter permease [bacterium]